MLKQVQHDDRVFYENGDRVFQDNKRRLPVMLKQVQHDDAGLGGAKNNFPTNNHMGYSSRVMQAAV
jgi:hypothetical protein